MKFYSFDKGKFYSLLKKRGYTVSESAVAIGRASDYFAYCGQQKQIPEYSAIAVEHALGIKPEDYAIEELANQTGGADHITEKLTHSVLYVSDQIAEAVNSITDLQDEILSVLYDLRRVLSDIQVDTSQIKDEWVDTGTALTETAQKKVDALKGREDK